MKAKRFLGMVRSPRTVLSIATVIVLGLVIYFSRHELAKAWGLLGQANVALLLLRVKLAWAVRSSAT
jgi:hypothetical protein